MMNRLPIRLAAIAWLLAIPAVAHPAFAQDESRQDIALQNEISELRHDLDVLRDQVASGAGGSSTPQSYPPPSAGAAPSSDLTAALLDRVSTLETQLRTIQGSVDEMRNTLQTQNADLTKQLEDMDFRVKTIEGGKPDDQSAPAPTNGAPPRTAPSRTAPPIPPGAPPVAAPPATAKATLTQGYVALARRDYPAAEAAARQNLAPRNPRAYDAQFLLAQSLAGQRSYQAAAIAYDDSYKTQRRGNHAQDSLIGLANALAAIGAKPAACATIEKLRSEFPAARPDIRASATATSRRAACS